MLIQSPSSQAETALTELEQQAQPLLKRLDELKVRSPEQRKNAEDLLILARSDWKRADETRKELTRPLDEAKRRIIKLFEPYMNRLETAINILNRELYAYREQLLALQREEERRLMAEQAARMKAAQETGEVLDPNDLPDDLPFISKTSRANLGTVTYREDWDIKVVDPDKVPRDLCEPSMPRIRARVKSGVTNIPGVLVTPRTISTTRKGGA